MIERFYLGQNKLSELPREMGDLRTLTCIDVSQNPKISKLPNELGRLEHLYMVCVRVCVCACVCPCVMDILPPS